MELTLEQALQKGIEAHKAGKVEEADQYYTAILKSNPKHPDANHNMGVLAVGVGKVEQALPFFKTALEVNQTIAQFWLSYIDALIKLDRMDDAKAVFDQAKSKGAKGDGFDQLEKSNPSFVGADKAPKHEELPANTLSFILELYGQGKVAEANVSAQRLLTQYSNNLTLLKLMGATAVQLGNFDQAINAFQKIISIDGDDADAYNNMGAALQFQGKKEAIDYFKKALFIKPDYADALNNLGNEYKEQGELSEAIKAYKKALSIKPDYAEAYNGMGVALQEDGKLEEAAVAYNKAISIKQDYAEAYNNLGVVLQDVSKSDEAMQAYEKALSIKPDYADVYYNMGGIFQDKGNWRKAAQAYKKALSIKPDYAEAYRGLSTIKKYSKNDTIIEQVEARYRNGEQNDDSKCNYNFTLSKMYDDVGDFEKA